MATEHQIQRAMLRHLLATILYRAAKAIDGAPTSMAATKVGDGARSALEILAHMGDLLDWTRSFVEGKPQWKESNAGAWDAEAARFRESARRLDAALAAEGPLAAPAERLLQGPLADALTHVGQLALLRRLAGAPVTFENFFKAEIGPEVPPARRASDRR